MVQNFSSILITGANRGIGLALVRELATRVPHPELVFATCRDTSGAKELKELAKTNNFVNILQLDLENEKTIVETIEEVRKQVGEKGLDIIINNAGIDDWSSLEESTVDKLMFSFRVNAVGTLMVTKAALNSITVQLASELKPDGIKVIALCPGWVRTDMGGPLAELAPEQSARQFFDLVDKLSMADSGRFFKINGKPLNW